MHMLPTYYVCVRTGYSTVPAHTLDEPWKYPQYYTIVEGLPTLRSRATALVTSRQNASVLGLAEGSGTVTLYSLPDCYDRDLQQWSLSTLDSLTPFYRQLDLHRRLDHTDVDVLCQSIRISDSNFWEDVENLISYRSRKREWHGELPSEERYISYLTFHKTVEAICSVLSGKEKKEVLSHLVRTFSGSWTYAPYVWTCTRLHRILSKGGMALSSCTAALLLREYGGDLRHDSECAIDLDHAHSLPVIPYHHEKRETHPYYLPFFHPRPTLPQRYSGPIWAGVCDLHTFRRRLSLFSGHPRLFDALRWDCYGLTGDAMMAILPENHPLHPGYEDHLYHQTVTDSQLEDYFENHYRDSTLDIVISLEEEEAYLSAVSSIVEKIQANTDHAYHRVHYTHHVYYHTIPTDVEWHCASIASSVLLEYDEENTDYTLVWHEEDTPMRRWITVECQSDCGMRTIRITPTGMTAPPGEGRTDLVHWVAYYSPENYSPLRAIYTGGRCILTPSAFCSYQTLTVLEDLGRKENRREKRELLSSRGWSVIGVEDAKPTSVPSVPPVSDHKNVIFA